MSVYYGTSNANKYNVQEYGLCRMAKAQIEMSTEMPEPRQRKGK
jgi:RNA:NAD 2'-phosphotransferase (TPT1/KptA family)